MLGPDDLRAAADNPAKKLMDFDHGVRHGSILHPPVAVPPPPFGLLGVTLSASLHDRYLACWEYLGAGRGLKPARASKSAGRASEPVVRALTTVGTS